MAAYMKNPTALVKQIHTVQHFLAEYIQPPLKRKGREFLTGFYIMPSTAAVLCASLACVSLYGKRRYRNEKNNENYTKQ